MVASIIDLIYPKRCLGCGEFGNYFCPNCLNRCQPLIHPICPICTKGSFFGQTHPRCQKPHNLDGLISIFPYYGIIKHAITKLKFKFVTNLNKDLVELTMSNTDISAISNSIWTITPVPLHPRRQRWRGFNQSLYLAQDISRYTHWPLEPNLLTRIKYTPPQVGLKRSERQANLVGAFSLHPKAPPIKNQNLLLIDDVWTTGATLKECAKVLKRNSAAKVWGLTVARAVNSKPNPSSILL